MRKLRFAIWFLFLTSRLNAMEVRISLGPMEPLPDGALGPWIGVGEQWVDFFDVAVGQNRYFDDEGFLVEPTTADRATFFERLALESAPLAQLPNHVVKVDIAWASLEFNPAEIYYDRTDFAVEFPLRVLGSQVIAVLGSPIPNWIQPFLYDAASGISLMQYRVQSVLSNDGVHRMGEERLEAWERYVAAAVLRYREMVEIWQILNEPATFLFSQQAFRDSGLTEERAWINSERFGELFDDFVFELIRRASRIIRELDPTARITALGLFDANNPVEIKQSRVLLEKLLDMGLSNYVDSVSFHIFPRQWPGLFEDPSTQTPEGEAISLDWATSPDPLLDLLESSGLDTMLDEWGHIIESPSQELLVPQFVTRLVAQNLAEQVSPLVFFEAYNYFLFSRDAVQDVDKYYLLKTSFPEPPARPPGLEGLEHLIRLLSGAVGESTANISAPHVTWGEFTGYSFRSFTNGLDRILVFWSNTSESIEPIIALPQGEKAAVEVVVFRKDGSVESHVIPGQVSEVRFVPNGIQPLGAFESTIVYFCFDPEPTITVEGGEEPVVTGVPVQLEAGGPSGVRLAPTWRVIQGSGLGVISQGGLFKGIRGGTCTVVADVGIHSASREISVIDLSENMLGNSNFNLMWKSGADWFPPPWRAVPPAERAAQLGARVRVISNAESQQKSFLGNAFARLDYPPTVGVGLDPELTRLWWPGYLSQTLISGMKPLGSWPSGEPLLFFCWVRRPVGAWSYRYLYLHLALFDRYRDPQNIHKLADVRIGGRVGPVSDWEMVSSLDELSVPYTGYGWQDADFTSPFGLIRFPPEVEQVEVILEIDNRFESEPTVADIDTVYLGPYRPLILLHSEIPSETVELAWFFDRDAYPMATIHLYLDADLDPTNGNEWRLSPQLGLPVISHEPFRLSTQEIPNELLERKPIFAYAEAAQGNVKLATDYAGPLQLITPTQTPGGSSTPTPTSLPSPTPTPLTPTPIPTEVPTPTFIPCASPTIAPERFFAFDSAEEFQRYPGGFVGAATGDVTVGSIPLSARGLSDGRGAVIATAPGEVELLLFPSVEVGDRQVFIRVSVQSVGAGAAIALAVLDSSMDGSMGTNIQADSRTFNGQYRRMVLLFDPPGPTVTPLFQVSNLGGEENVSVYVDNMEVFALPREGYVPFSFLRGD